MTTSIAGTIGRILESLPRQGVHRDVALLGLAEMYAAHESIVALRAAADRARSARRPDDAEGEAVGDALTASSELWNGNGVSVLDEGNAAWRDMLARALRSPAFAAVLPQWVAELRQVAEARPGSGACTVATALQLWHWTLTHATQMPGADEAAVMELAEAFCWLAAARAQVLDTIEPASALTAEHHAFLIDLCHVQAVRAAGTVSTRCAEIVFGSRQHPRWDAEGCASCYSATELDELEGWMPGLASGAYAHGDVIEADGSHPPKAGPCAKRTGVEPFVQLRTKLDGCLTGGRIAKQRAAATLPRILAGPVPASAH
jgi:hypothetical protein